MIDIALQNVRYDNGENTTGDVHRHAAEWIEANRAQCGRVADRGPRRRLSRPASAGATSPPH